MYQEGIMKHKDKIAVFIDGSNLFYKLRDSEIGIKNSSKFDYKGLAKWLARDRKIVYLGYYVGIVRAKPDNKKGQVMRREQ